MSISRHMIRLPPGPCLSQGSVFVSPRLNTFTGSRSSRKTSRIAQTFASRLVQAGVRLYDLGQLMGHESLEMVQRYAHLAPDYQERAIKALNELGHNMGTAPSRMVA